MRTKNEIEVKLQELKRERVEHEHILSEYAESHEKADVAKLLLANVDSEIEALQWTLGLKEDMQVATNQISDILNN